MWRSRCAAGHPGQMAIVELDSTDPDRSSPTPCAATGYLPDEGLATAAFLALRMHRPLFLEGDAGVGKTSLAQALAEVHRRRAGPAAVLRGHRRHPGALRLGLPRQILHLRAAETAGVRPAATDDAAELETLAVRPAVPDRPADPAGDRAQPVGAADRRDRPGRRRVRGVPARGAGRQRGHHPGARHHPGRARRRWWCSPPTAPARCTTRSSGAASTTGWRTRPSSARWRSCARRLPEITERLAREVAARGPPDARGRPAQAARGGRVDRLGAGAAPARRRSTLDPERAAATLGAVLKYQEDAARIRDTVLAELAG